MRKRQKRGLRFFPLVKYVKARRDARTYRRLYKEEFIGKAIAEARTKIARTDATLATSLYEWLITYPLQAKTPEELAKYKEEWRAFHEGQFKKYQEKRNGLREVRLLIDGKTETYRVPLL